MLGISNWDWLSHHALSRDIWLQTAKARVLDKMKL